MTTETRSLADDRDPTARTADHLYCIVDGERLGASWRFALTGVDEVEIGRGKDDAVRRSGARLRLDRLDPWMSAVHARLVRDGILWAVEDAGARNGVRVNGHRVGRALVDTRDLIELGRSFFVVHRDEPAAEPVVTRATEPGGTATVVPAFARRLEELGRLALTAAPILLRGATGTGKDRLAALVHARSGRTGALVPINCGALPATLVQSELFGYRKGAFSGATESHAGLAAAADGGTLFLDEVAELSPAAQVALLRLLEQKELRPLGATTASRVDLRVVAATHRDLSRLVATGEFRDDLGARLCGFELVVPGLADRIVDLGIILGEHVPSRIRASNAALRAIARHRWPRNVRELVRALEQAIALANGDTIEHRDLPAVVRGEAGPDDADPPAPAQAPAQDDETRRARLIALLEKHHGNVTRIAAEMGKARIQIQRWLDRYELDAATYRR
jgi:DNA-binding NtrC family response regulator